MLLWILFIKKLKQTKEMLVIMDYSDLLDEIHYDYSYLLNKRIPILINNDSSITISMLDELYTIGMDINETNCDGLSGLFLVTYYGREKLTRWFLNHNANPNIYPLNVNSILQYALNWNMSLNTLYKCIITGANTSTILDKKYILKFMDKYHTDIVLEANSYDITQYVIHIVSSYIKSCDIHKENSAKFIQRKWLSICYHPDYIWKDGRKTIQRLFN